MSWQDLAEERVTLRSMNTSSYLLLAALICCLGKSGGDRMNPGVHAEKKQRGNRGRS